jgi:hypothetical protein
MSRQLNTVVNTFQEYKKAPTILLHSGASGGQEILEQLGQQSKLRSKEFSGIPAHIVPLLYIILLQVELRVGYLPCVME